MEKERVEKERARARAREERKQARIGDRSRPINHPIPFALVVSRFRAVLGACSAHYTSLLPLRLLPLLAAFAV